MLGQKAAHIDAGGLRPFRNADGAAFQVLGLADAAIAAHVDRRMAMDPRRKHRDRDHRGVPLRRERGVFPERQLRDVPFEVAGEPEGDLLDRRKHQRRERDAVDPHHAAGELAHMLVVADRERQVERSDAAADDDLRVAQLRCDSAGAIGAVQALDIHVMEAPQGNGTPLLGGRAIRRNDAGAGRVVVFGRSDSARRCRAHITVISGWNADKG